MRKGITFLVFRIVMIFGVGKTFVYPVKNINTFMFKQKDLMKHPKK